MITPLMSEGVTTSKAEKIIVSNRAAYHEYHILETYEAGVSLKGTEVKSIVEGRIQLKDSYVAVRDGEGWLMNAHVSPYSHGNRENHDPLRSRKLLLHRRELNRLEESATLKGMTLVVTKVYLKGGRIKLEVGVARGKKLFDKRETEKRRTIEKETRAELKNYKR
ncbi:MAG: SsrA-binding protein SmpB [Pyrinomonadaceae bacterium]